MAEVWHLDLDHGQQAVMLVLADHAHDDGTKAFPGVEYIAWKTNYSRRQVQRYLAALEKSGIIEAVAYSFGGRGHSTEYALHLAKGAKKSPFIKSERATTATRKGDILNTKGDTHDVKGDIAVSPQPLVTINKPSTNHQAWKTGLSKESSNRPKRLSESELRDYLGTAQHLAESDGRPLPEVLNEIPIHPADIARLQQMAA